MSTPGQFAVSNGAATYTVPIQLPPGVAGVQPALALTYSSQGGNGLLGIGWNLSGLSSITRCARNPAQDAGAHGTVSHDLTDRYCLDGQRLLATISGTDGANNAEYRTERESFSKIVSYSETGATNGPGSFIVKTTAGLTMEYGKTTDSRIEAQGKPTVVAVWALSKVYDTKGNYYTVSYTENNANGEYYPARIDYTGNAGSAPVVNPQNTVFFDYEARPDVVPTYQAGSLTKITQRLKRVRTQGAGGVAIKEYRMAYNPAALPMLSSTLSSIQECVPSSGICLPAITLVWKPQPAGVWTLEPSRMMPDFLAADGNEDIGAQLIDLNGDGLLDFVRARYVNASTQLRDAWLNTGNGWIAAPQYILPEYLAQDGISTIGAQLIDLNGDGLPDFTRARAVNGSERYRDTWLNTGNGWIAAPQYILPEYLAQDGFTTIGAQLIDLNGDGLPDFTRARAVNGSVRYRDTWLNTGNGWIAAPQYILPEYLAQDGFSTIGAQLIDLNGDGLPDFTRARAVNGSERYRDTWLNQTKPVLLDSVNAGIGSATVITYGYLPQVLGDRYKKELPSVYKKAAVVPAMPVVTDVSSSNGVGGTSTTSYSYGNLLTDMSATGRGSLGFQWVQSKDVSSGVVSRTYYRQDWPYLGLVDKSGKGTSEANWSNLGLTVNTSFVCSAIVGTAAGAPCTTSGTNPTVKPGARYFIYPNQIDSQAWEYTGMTSTDGIFIALPRNRTTQTLDDYGNATLVKVETLNPDGSASGYSKTTTSVFANDTANWYLGRLLRSSVTATAP